MGTRIIRQRGGKFGLYSTISDRIYVLDCTEEELVRIWREEAADRAEYEMRTWLNEIRTKVGYIVDETTLTLSEALKQHQFIGGDVSLKPEYMAANQVDQEVRRRKRKKKKK